MPRVFTRIRIVLLFLILLVFAQVANSKEKLKVVIGYLHFEVDNKPVLSNILPEPDDAGLRGAQLAVNDSNTTGKFLGHEYLLLESRSDDVEELIATAKQWQTENGVQFFVLNLPEGPLLKFAAELSGTGSLMFNAGSRSNNLRSDQCPPNTLHTRPSDAMLTDALGQWYVSRKQKEWFLISGSQPEDKAFTDSLKRTARRFGIEIMAEKDWTFDTDLRRTAQKEMPIFTRAKEYDAVVVADVRGDFGEYVLYNTWLPRPVAGTQGLKPVTWHRVVEQWGAAQLQSRFEKLSGRWMNSADYAAWAAVRSVSEAVTKTGVNDVNSVTDYVVSEAFELAGFKGRKLSYRKNGQLRQPIPLIHDRALVALAPMEGFLHAGSDLDSLGLDSKESTCQFSLQQ